MCVYVYIHSQNTVSKYALYKSLKLYNITVTYHNMLSRTVTDYSTRQHTITCYKTYNYSNDDNYCITL